MIGDKFALSVIWSKRCSVILCWFINSNHQQASNPTQLEYFSCKKGNMESTVPSKSLETVNLFSDIFRACLQTFGGHCICLDYMTIGCFLLCVQYMAHTLRQINKSHCFPYHLHFFPIQHTEYWFILLRYVFLFMKMLNQIQYKWRHGRVVNASN